MEFQERLEAIRNDGLSLRRGTGHKLRRDLELVTVLRSQRQPAWGYLTMAIFLTAKYGLIGDGHTRAARREAAWYPF